MPASAVVRLASVMCVKGLVRGEHVVLSSKVILEQWALLGGPPFLAA